MSYRDERPYTILARDLAGREVVAGKAWSWEEAGTKLRAANLSADRRGARVVRRLGEPEQSGGRS